MTEPVWYMLQEQRRASAEAYDGGGEMTTKTLTHVDGCLRGFPERFGEAEDHYGNCPSPESPDRWGACECWCHEGQTDTTGGWPVPGRE